MVQINYLRFTLIVIIFLLLFFIMIRFFRYSYSTVNSVSAQAPKHGSNILQYFSNAVVWVSYISAFPPWNM